MAEGRRRRDLEKTAKRCSPRTSRGASCPSIRAAAAAYAELFAARRRAGRPTAPLDLMIAAIARANDASMVTRNVDDFEGCGLALINPWEPS